MNPTASLAWLRSSESLTSAVVGSLTLGLAPFVPEPHIVGKVRWVLGGGVGMQLIDHADLLLHGAPWLLLLAVIAVRLVDRIRLGRPTAGSPRG